MLGYPHRHPQEQTPPGADTPLEQTPPRTRHPPGEDTPREQTPPQEQTPPGTRHPPRRRHRHTVNEWPVRILLECILVSPRFFSYVWKQKTELQKFPLPGGEFHCSCGQKQLIQYFGKLKTTTIVGLNHCDCWYHWFTDFIFVMQIMSMHQVCQTDWILPII